VVLRKVSGRISDCEIGDNRKGGLFSENAAGLEIAHNHVRDCGDNGILVWRSDTGEDGTIVTSNRIERIAAKSGLFFRKDPDSRGNGISIEADTVVSVTDNLITGSNDGAIRAMNGPTPIGSDLAHGAEAYRNLAVYSNVAR
jgi:hypothetical protein